MNRKCSSHVHLAASRVAQTLNPDQRSVADGTQKPLNHIGVSLGSPDAPPKPGIDNPPSRLVPGPTTQNPSGPDPTMYYVKRRHLVKSVLQSNTIRAYEQRKCAGQANVKLRFICYLKQRTSRSHTSYEQQPRSKMRGHLRGHVPSLSLIKSSPNN
jgi:hypothetical protein